MLKGKRLWIFVGKPHRESTVSRLAGKPREYDNEKDDTEESVSLDMKKKRLWDTQKQDMVLGYILTSVDASVKGIVRKANRSMRAFFEKSFGWCRRHVLLQNCQNFSLQKIQK